MPRPRTDIVAGDAGHVPDSNHGGKDLRNIAYATGDYGMDRTGASDNSGLFATAMGELRTAGGGTLMLDDGVYMGRVEVLPTCSLKGRGYSSVVQGPPGGGATIVTVDGYSGETVEDLQIIGTRSIAGLPDGPIPNGINDPEIGLLIRQNPGGAGGYQYHRRVLILNTRGIGYYGAKGGLHGDSLVTFWTGGPGVYIHPGIGFDGRYSNFYIGPCFSVAGIACGAGPVIWTNCRSYGQGSWITNGGQIRWNPNDRTASAWSVSGAQILNGCYADDSPIGFYVFRGGNRINGIAGGCLDPVFVNLINPDGTDGDNDIDVSVFCQDRFTPRCALYAYLPWGTDAKLHVNWETATIPSPQGMNVGTKIRDYVDPETGPFKVVRLSPLSAGTPTLYDRNSYHVHGEDAWVKHTVSVDGAVLTPDMANGFNYIITLDGALTINAPVHRGAIAAGRKLKFFFTRPGGHPADVVTWDAAWRGAPQPGAAVSMVEFVNLDGLFAQSAFGPSPYLKFAAAA